MTNGHMQFGDKSPEQEAAYWDNFYASFNLSIPSQFAVFTAVDLQRSVHAVFEIGCGNGRDAMFFAEKGFTTSAIDKSPTAIEHNTHLVEGRKMRNINFNTVDVEESDKIKSSIDSLRRTSHVSTIVVYSRFFLHSITTSQQDQLICCLQDALVTGDKVYLEYRSTPDAEIRKTFTNHYRRFVDTDALCKLVVEHDFVVDYQISGQGMARYMNEDAYVSRVILTKS